MIKISIHPYIISITIQRKQAFTGLYISSNNSGRIYDFQSVDILELGNINFVAYLKRKVI